MSQDFGGFSANAQVLQRRLLLPSPIIPRQECFLPFGSRCFLDRQVDADRVQLLEKFFDAGGPLLGLLRHDRTISCENSEVTCGLILFNAGIGDRRCLFNNSSAEVPGKGSPAGTEFEDHASETINVGLTVEMLAANLFRGHVAACPHDFVFAAEQATQLGLLFNGWEIAKSISRTLHSSSIR